MVQSIKHSMELLPAFEMSLKAAQVDHLLSFKSEVAALSGISMICLPFKTISDPCWFASIRGPVQRCSKRDVRLSWCQSISARFM